MTIRKLVLLASLGCLFVAAVSAAAIDWLGLAHHSIREDSEGWGWAGVFLFALSTWDSAWMTKRYGG